MRFVTAPAPHLPPRMSVPSVMREVLYALVPAALAYTWYFGPGLLINATIAVTVAVTGEAAVLRLRSRPVQPAIGDFSAVVTGVLLAFALPPLSPWWVTATGAVFAIVIAKHLYGGLGFNPFNPAMVGYVVLLASFPREMTVWLPPRGLEVGLTPIGFTGTLGYVLSGNLPAGLSVDAITAATPLDAMQTGLGQMRMISEIRADGGFGSMGGHGWEWIGNWIAVGGLWLLYRGIIRWHIPVAVLAGLAVTAGFFHLINADAHPSAGFHLFSGAALLCAFFIATDPVSAATTLRGRLIYGAGIGVLIYVIRTWAKSPDGVAYAVLLMNMSVPAIEHFTQPRVYGHE